MLKKLFSQTAIYGLAPQIPKIAGILTLPIITKSLTTLDFGVYGLITAIAGSFAILNTLGLNISLSNTFYKSPGHYKWAWRQLYGFLILWNFPFSFLVGCIIYLFVPAEAKSNALIISILNVLPIAFFGPTSLIGSCYYQYKQKPYPIALRSILIGLLTVLLNIYFISVLKMGYMGWFISICISEMTNHISYFLPIYSTLKLKPIFNFKRRFILQQLKISLPTIPHYYANYLLNTSDRVVMKFSKISTFQIGMYNAANIPGNFVQSIAFASGKAIGPMLYQSYRDKNEHVSRKLIFNLQVVFLVATFVLCIWLKEGFVLLIKNKELQSTYHIAIIIVMAYNYRPMYFGANTRLFYLEKTKVLLKITLVAGVSNLLLNVLFIRLFGYEVAAFTTFITLMYMGYIGYYLKVFKEHSSLNYYPMFWLFLTAVLTAVSYFIVDLSVTFKIFTTLAIIATGFFALRFLDKNPSFGDTNKLKNV